MLLFSYYLLKVIICSTVLYGYYWFFLRNKVFHSYNRFYLLATIVLSLTLPLLKFNIWQKADAPKIAVVKMLQVVNSSDEYMDEVIIQSHYNHVSKETVALWIFMAMCAAFAIMFMKAMFKIYSLKRNNPQQHFDGINLIHTSDKKTPFSFLKNIFWNDEIDINSNNGKRILKHEVAHVQEKHSHDKLFINIVLIFFWMNPLFWLIRKELNMIHEFIADKKAVEDGDTSAFAAMILQATYPTHRFELTNNFFYSPIKRRLTMLTKNKTKMSYISRVLVLPLAVIVFAAFTLKAKTHINKLPKNKTITVVIDAGHGGTDNGAVAADGTLEKDLTLSLAKKIQELNRSENIKIILIRDNDISQDPKEKAATANKLGAELFISLHIDNTPTSAIEKKSGLTTLVVPDEFKTAAASKAFASAITSAFEGNYQLPVAANPVQRKRAMAIIRETHCPAVLIEAGFMSNEKDLAYLKSIDGQEQFARNILNAILSYENSTRDDKAYNTTGSQALVKTTGKTVEADDINIGPNVPKGSVIVTANNRILKEGNDYSIDYKHGKIKILNKTITDAAIPVEVSFTNNATVQQDAAPDFKPVIVKLTDNNKTDAGEYVHIDSKNNFSLKNLLDMFIDLKGREPLVFLNDKQVDVNVLMHIDTNRIENVRMYLSTGAIYKYGDKAQNGAIEITLKKDLHLTLSGIIGPKIRVSDLDKIHELKVDDNDYQVTYATVYFSGTGFPDVMMTEIKDGSLKSLESNMQKITAGSVITFDNVFVSKKDGSEKTEITPKSFGFYDKNVSEVNFDGHAYDKKL